MSAAEILNFSELLEAIPGENPAGMDLRPDISSDAPYQRLKTARDDSRRIERDRAEGKGNGVEPQWRLVCELAPEILSKKAKDILVAVWLTEALLRHHGFAGLRDGLRLIRELIEKYWLQLHPLPDRESFDDRLIPLESMAATLPAAINIQAMTDSKIIGPFHLSHYKWALDLEQVIDPDKKSKRIANGAITMQMIEKAVRDTRPEFFRTRLQDIRDCQTQLTLLSTALDQHCAANSPNLSPTRTALEECADMLQKLAPTAISPISTPDAAAPSAEGAASASTVAPSSSFQGREDAFAALLRIAQFFKETEPHSPVSYVLEQAVRWGRKPLPELWAELIGEEGARKQVFKLVGIPPEPTKPAGGT